MTHNLGNPDYDLYLKQRHYPLVILSSMDIDLLVQNWGWDNYWGYRGNNESLGCSILMNESRLERYGKSSRYKYNFKGLLQMVSSVSKNADDHLDARDVWNLEKRFS